jgi:hypothetical protein
LTLLRARAARDALHFHGARGARMQKKTVAARGVLGAMFQRGSRLWHPACKCKTVVNIKLQKSMIQPDTHTPGSIYSFVPAHGGSRAAAVAMQLCRIQTEGLGASVLLAHFDARGGSPWRSKEAPARPNGNGCDARTWDSLVSEIDGIDALEANDIHPSQLRQVLECAREHYSIVCADLTGARESYALEALRASDGIFLVAGADAKSLEGVRDKLDWLRSFGLSERCGLLLAREPKGASLSDAEDLTGVPLCSLVETESQIEQLARWLAGGTSRALDDEKLQYAMAV